MYYSVCYFTCIFYAVVRQISMLFIDNKDSVFCILYSVHINVIGLRKLSAIGQFFVGAQTAVRL